MYCFSYFDSGSYEKMWQRNTKWRTLNFVYMMIFYAVIGLKSRTALVPLVLAVTETIPLTQRVWKSGTGKVIFAFLFYGMTGLLGLTINFSWTLSHRQSYIPIPTWPATLQLPAADTHAWSPILIKWNHLLWPCAKEKWLRKSDGIFLHKCNLQHSRFCVGGGDKGLQAMVKDDILSSTFCRLYSLLVTH